MRAMTSALCIGLVLGVGARAVSAQDDAHNLLTNPGFEEGAREADGWTIADLPRGVAIRRDNRITLDGGGSLKLSKSTDNYFPPAGATQTITREADWSAIEVGADVRTVRATKLVLDVQFAGDGQEAHEWAAFIGAASPDDPPLTHDWKRYSGVVVVPAWAETITIAVQIWGPGTAWVDNVSASVVEGAAPAAESPSSDKPGSATPASETNDAPAAAPPQPGEDVTIDADANRRYFLHGPKGAAPAQGYRLLVVLPGGDGSADFQPFVANILARALPEGYIIAQGVAPVWTDSDERIVWPTQQLPDENMAFPTERFVTDIIADVSERHRVDPSHVYMLGWSSGGPASYAAALAPNSPVRGALVAMSVFKPEILPPISGASGKAFYMLHSPQDFIPMRYPEAARDRLARTGAKTTLETYTGGHGWHGDAFAMIRAGVEWLENNAEPAPRPLLKPAPRLDREPTPRP